MKQTLCVAIVGSISRVVFHFSVLETVGMVMATGITWSLAELALKWVSNWRKKKALFR